jgi:hypothetical protein
MQLLIGSYIANYFLIAAKSNLAVVAIWGTVSAQMITSVDQRRLDENLSGLVIIKPIAITNVPAIA